MKERALAWIRAHPEVNARVVWNFPGNVAVVGTWKAACLSLFVLLNVHARELTEEMTRGIDPEPTLLMVRASLEAALKEASA
jgi:hypothetical protein